MNVVVRVLSIAGICLVAAGLGWRRLSRSRRAPCPAWLGWILENPYSGFIAGSRLLLDRAGVGPGMRVLDAGCGTGRLALAAAERVGSEGKVVALDLQPAMLEQVRNRAFERGFANLRTVAGAIESMTTSEGAEAQFDRALLVTVLGEIPDRVAALRVLHRVVRPGGILSVTEFLPDPHYQGRSTVRRLAESTGFVAGRSFGGVLAFTTNFHKPG